MLIQSGLNGEGKLLELGIEGVVKDNLPHDLLCIQEHMPCKTGFSPDPLRPAL